MSTIDSDALRQKSTTIADQNQIIRPWIILTLTTIFSGCTDYKPFQPPPNPSESWKKAGASEKDVTEALLECGFTQPIGRVPGLREKMTLNEDAQALLCMEGSEFKARYGNSYSDFCKNFKYVESCKPGTAPVSRDVSKRLKSQFCLKFPHADACSRQFEGRP